MISRVRGRGPEPQPLLFSRDPPLLMSVIKCFLRRSLTLPFRRRNLPGRSLLPALWVRRLNIPVKGIHRPNGCIPRVRLGFFSQTVCKRTQEGHEFTVSCLFLPFYLSFSPLLVPSCVFITLVRKWFGNGKRKDKSEFCNHVLFKSLPQTTEGGI